MNYCIVFALALLAFASLSPASSAQITALNADFSQDTVGEPPTLDIPGDPVGDYLVTQTDAGSIYVTDSFGAMVDQPLVMERTDFGVLSIAAHLAPDLVSCSSYLVKWIAMIDQEVDYFEVSFRSGANAQLAQLQYASGSVLNMNGSDNPIGTGYQAVVAQLFELTVDMVAETTSLSVNGEPVAEAQNLPFLEVNQTGSFENILFVAGGAEFMTFYLDDLLVEATCEPTAAAPTTWSMLKTRYQ